MLKLWDQLGHLFRDDSGEDNGTLPDILIQNLTSAEVGQIYSWVRRISSPWSAQGRPTLWHRDLQSDMPIDELVDPAQLVDLGFVDPFCHLNTGLTMNGILIPDLSIGIYSNQVRFDYEVGPEWGPPQLQALFEFLLEIQVIAPKCDISHVSGGHAWPTHVFANAWREFLQKTL